MLIAAQRDSRREAVKNDYSIATYEGNLSYSLTAKATLRAHGPSHDDNDAVSANFGIISTIGCALRTHTRYKGCLVCCCCQGGNGGVGGQIGWWLGPGMLHVSQLLLGHERCNTCKFLLLALHRLACNMGLHSPPGSQSTIEQYSLITLQLPERAGTCARQKDILLAAKTHHIPFHIPFHMICLASRNARELH